MSAPASAVIETTVTVPALIGIPGPQGATGPVGPPGTQTFTVAGNSGPSQTIGNGDTLTLTSPVAFQQVVMSAVDTATFEWPNQTGNVFLASPANGSAGTPAFRAIVFADLDAVLGTMAQQDANAVAITGGTMSAVAITLGTINNTPIGGTTPSTGAFTVATLADGSAGTPSLNFANTTNMGMYRFGAGEIGFSIGGNVAMQLNSVGLGLGTTAAVKLDLSSGSATTIRVRTTAANNTQIHFIRTGIAEYAIGYNNSDTSFRIANNATVGTNDRVIISTAGVFTHNETDAGTNNTVTTLILQRNSTGTPAANFASRLLWQLESSTTENRDAAAIDVLWTTATDATRTSRMDFYTVNSGTLTLAMQLTPTATTVNGNTILGDNSADTLTINGTAVTTPNGLNFDSNTLIIDAANNRVGIRNTPSYPFHVFGTDGATVFGLHGSSRVLLTMLPLSSDSGLWVSGFDNTNAETFRLASQSGPSFFRATGQNFGVGTNAPASKLHVLLADAGTNDTQNVMILGRNSTGTPAANFASRLLWQLESSTTENVDAASMVVSHVIPTHASRTERVQHFVNDSGGAREYLRGEASGSAPMIGFLGAAAVIRQALGAWAGLTDAQKLDALRDALTNLGLTSYT